ncbi:MAG TPA: DUF268 domain-containing protein [Candidatus Thermoplasmatota archaeon]|nr:DUF268 domain-containing protein [Candidatus Thermoplasmatota archaeon]
MVQGRGSSSFGVALKRWVSPVVDPSAILRGLRGYVWFARDWRRYKRMPGAEPLSWREAYPVLHDKVATSPYDAHYFFQDNWALRRILENRPARHVDVGSRVDTVAHVAASVPTTFVDLRPLEAKVEGLDSRAGTILSLPYGDDSVESLSCLHVAEHIGLGRYGDPLDPQGTRKACQELQRVLAPGGNLYFALPVGRERVAFNANRVHAPRTILGYFDRLALVEFSAVDDCGVFHRATSPESVEGEEYACGMFWLRKEPQRAASS